MGESQDGVFYEVEFLDGALNFGQVRKSNNSSIFIYKFLIQGICIICAIWI